MVQPAGVWQPVNVDVESKQKSKEKLSTNGYLKFETGILTPAEISLIFNHLPIDITFTDKDGVVKYFSQGKDRIFARTKTIIGRKVENCHPPASVHVIEVTQDIKSIQDLSGEKRLMSE